LVPIATIIWLRRRKKYPLMLLPCLYMGALVQGLAIFLTNSREPKALGATVALFTKITGQIFFGHFVWSARFGLAKRSFSGI
jgi:hypothetical protein